MVTPDIHWSVHLDLVTGPPETTDDDEIQCLGRMLLNSLEDHVDEAVGDAMGAKKSLQFSLWDHTLAALLKCFRRAEVVRVLENLKGWSWLLLSIAVAMVPREVVSSDRPRGGAPPQRIDSLSSAMTLRECVCENGTRV